LNELLSITDIKAEKARRNFYDYCQFREPEFYKESRPHLKILCDTLNAFYYNKILKEDGTPYTKLMIRIPPQHGKSRTLVNYTQWCLGKNNEERVITASYNDTQAGDFARYTRDGIQEEKNMPDQRVFSDVFPDCKIKQGNASYQKWALEGQHFNYLGVGVGGGVTGKGATIRIIDDLVKDIETASNAAALEKIWLWYAGTYSSRISAEGGEVKEIFCATLWSNKDPQGILEQDEKDEWYILKMEAWNGETMLCNDILNKQSYDKLKARMIKNPITKSTFWANYHSKSVSVEGALYSKFNTYSILPFEPHTIKSYTDTADMGDDYLCCIIYAEYEQLKYVLDVVYTQDPNEITEPLLAAVFENNNVNEATIESNNGGRAFARNVERICKENKHYNTEFIWFYQSKNKEARIKSNSNNVQTLVVYPEDWAVRWPEYYDAMTTYLAKGKNKQDDAPDTTTGVVENRSRNYF
jgi:predicted phage terminase large subunit-like protein